jgi:hypothetical protein
MFYIDNLNAVELELSRVLFKRHVGIDRLRGLVGHILLA